MPTDSRISDAGRGLARPPAAALPGGLDAAEALAGHDQPGAASTTASASAAVPSSSNDSSGPKPRGIWARAMRASLR